MTLGISVVSSVLVNALRTSSRLNVRTAMRPSISSFESLSVGCVVDVVMAAKKKREEALNGNAIGAKSRCYTRTLQKVSFPLDDSALSRSIRNGAHRGQIRDHGYR